MFAAFSFAAVFALCLAAPTFLVIEGRFLLAAASMMCGAVLPFVLARLANVDNPVPALVTMLLLPLSLIMLAVALVGWASSLVRKAP